MAGTTHTSTFRYAYGSGGRLYQVTYPKPSGVATFSVSYQYDAAGYARQIIDDVTGASLWLLEHADEASQPRIEQFGNGAVTTREFNPLSLQPEGIETAIDGAPLQDLSYEWSAAGDLLLRHDHLHAQYEQFTYDALHRLDTTTSNWGATTVDYDVLGNITQKSDVGPYYYDVDGALEWVGSAAFGVDHDDAGQVTHWGPQTLTWTTAGQVRTIGDAAGTKTMSYAAEDDRVLTSNSGNKTAIVTVGDRYELRLVSGQVDQWVQRVVAPTGRIVAQRTSSFDGWGVDTSYSYLHDDHLGSTSVVSPANGNPASAIQVANDAWGYTRAGDAWDKAFTGDLADVGVGFTGHRAPLDKGLVYMRGRMYDPWAARFMSPDPIVIEPRSVQAWNPYSYVLNRPLVFRDPTGFAADGDGCDVDICADDDIVIGSSGGSRGADQGMVDFSGTGGKIWSWSGVYANVRLLDSIVPGTGLAVGLVAYQFRGILPISGPNPWGENPDFRVRPAIGAPSHEPDADCTGTCAIARAVDQPIKYGQLPLSPQQDADYNAGHIEFMNTNAGIWSVKVTTEFILAGGIGIAGEILGGMRAGLAAARAAGTACFAAGTLVATENGLRPIEEVEVGDLVWARDDETGEEGWKPVVQVVVTRDKEVHELVFEAEDGTAQVLRVTADHPLWSLDDREWDEAGHLDLGEQVDALHGPMWLVSAVALPATKTVYNFEVADSHTYFVGDAGVWAHNNGVCVKIGGQAWRAFRVGEQVCVKGCDDAARAIQNALGGEIKHITGTGRYLGGVKDIGGTAFKNPAGNAAAGWSDHFVVVKGGRVYDALTGPAGQTISAYKARWQYADAISFGF